MVLFNPAMRALLSDQTCGDACWKAREDICRCQCGGVNHGCLRGKDGEQPTRTRRLDGVMYRLQAVPTRDTHNAPIHWMNAIEDQQRAVTCAAKAAGIPNPERSNRSGEWGTHYHEAAILKTATQAECARWPELAQWRDGMRPWVLWVRADIPETLCA